MWDRGVIDCFSGRGFKGLVLKLFGKQIVTAKKLSPIFYYKEGPGQDKTKTEGIIAYILRNCADYYTKGISVYICPEITDLIQGVEDRYVFIPFYCYDGKQFTVSDEKIKADTQIVRHFGARNYVSVYLPDYGILTINTADETLLKIENGKFVHQADLIQRLDILINMVETASLASLGQLRGEAGARLLWEKEKHLRHTSTKLIQNEKEFRNLYENAPVAYLSINSNGIIQKSNRRAKELLGYNESELFGKAANSLLVDKSKISHILYQNSTATPEQNSVTDIELQLRRKDQAHIWFSLSIDTIKDKSGDISEYRVAANDITDRKLAEGKIKKAQEELEEYSKTLEHKVAERTAELLKTNARLQNEIKIRKQAEEKKEVLISDLQNALEEVKSLSGLLPICASCKKIRDDRGYWNQIEGYIQKHSEAQFSHGICPDCAKKLYPELDIKEKNR